MTKRYLVTGGAGFIGSNYVERLLKRAESVVVYDNLSRDGAKKNLKWLQDTFGDKAFEFIQADIRDAAKLASAASHADVIVHLAAQVAVTTSVRDPRADFEDNALGTFNVLEAARTSGRNPVVIYASTNKVYGGLEDLKIIEKPTRYDFAELKQGVSESYPLDFHSPYGCSKGAGDQYVRDYARIYDLPTVVMRQSCIYGPRQFGMEDQGWVAWFIIRLVQGKPFTIYGDGKQVRDVLHVEDLLDSYDLVLKNINSVAGKIYNIGGGPANTLSVWSEFRPILEELFGKSIQVGFDEWRPGDQKVFISDISKAQKEFGWKPKIDVKSGISKLYIWIRDNTALFA